MLGGLTGLAATAFIRGLHASEECSIRIVNPYLRHVLGMLLVGMMMYGLFLWHGHYFVEGVGYSTIQDILLGGRGRACRCCCCSAPASSSRRR